MLSATLKTGLEDYEIGGKIRTLRLKKKIGLVELGKHTGLSPAMLSKIERGRLFPTLPTLLRIALVFGVGLEFFFAGAREKPVVAVVRRRERVRLPERPTAGDSAFHFESLDYPAVERRFNTYYAEFLPLAPERRRRPCPPRRGVHLRPTGNAERADRSGRTPSGARRFGGTSTRACLTATAAAAGPPAAPSW